MTRTKSIAAFLNAIDVKNIIADHVNTLYITVCLAIQLFIQKYVVNYKHK